MAASAVRASFAGLLLLGVIGGGLLGANRAIAVVRVAGESMHPTLHAGDVCLVRRTDRVKIGDVVLYHEPEHRTPVLHRVIDQKRGRYVTRGDANPVVDFAPLDRSSIAGRVLAVLPFGGMLERWRRPDGGATLHNQSHTPRR